MSGLEQQVHKSLETLRGELDRIKAMMNYCDVLLAEKDAEIEQLKWAARVNSDEWKQRVESLKVEITELRTRLGKPRCIDCN